MDSFDALLDGFRAIGDEPRMIAMWFIAAALLYVGIARRKEPLLLVPIAFGILLANLPVGEFVRTAGDGKPEGFVRLFQDVGLATEILPLLVFLGLGALTDFSPMLSNPRTILLGAGAQAGVFIALLGALVLSAIGLFDFGLPEASAIGIIGGADGATTIFISTRMRELGASIPGLEVRDIIGATAVAAYSYMALVPIIQPPLIRLLTSREERRIRMPYEIPPVSRRTRILFPIITTVVVAILVPAASPLIGVLMFGNLLRESGVVERLSRTAQNELTSIVVIFLGLAVGGTMSGAVFLQVETIGIFILGIFAFAVSTIAGVLLARLMNLFTSEKINPMIGAAGVSAVPTAARVVQQMAQEEDPENFLLMHAMGPNVAGVIGTITAAGVLLALVPTLI